jgi:DNA adenine methylase
MAKPFIKWAGGKRQLMEHLLSRLPSDFGDDEYRKYAEPFVGGGALMFKMFELKLIDEALIIDYNMDLVLTYEVIKSDVALLIEKLSILQHDYDAYGYEERKKQYFELRTKFNSRLNDEKSSFSLGERAERASQFIYLNKVGFNGLFRVNIKGEFNVPPSDLKSKTIVDHSNLKKVSKVLQSVTIRSGDFSDCIDWVDEDTFVYFDPPYKPISKTSFTAYANSNFNDTQQERLADFCILLKKKEVRAMVSNSDPTQMKPPDHLFERIYSLERGFTRKRVAAIRSINSNGAGRGSITELIITNY